MTSFRLLYFPQHGRALAIRLLFLTGDVPFSDDIIRRKEWDASEPRAGWHTLPQLTHDDQVLIDTPAITAHVGRHTGHWPEDPLDQARAFALLNRTDDVWTMFAQVVRPLNPIVKAWRFWDVLRTGLPRYCAGVERSFTGDFLLGDAPMAPDYAVFAVLHVAQRRAGRLGVDKVIARHPRLQAMLIRVGQDSVVADAVARKFA